MPATSATGAARRMDPYTAPAEANLSCDSASAASTAVSKIADRLAASATVRTVMGRAWPRMTISLDGSPLGASPAVFSASSDRTTWHSSSFVSSSSLHYCLRDRRQEAVDDEHGIKRQPLLRHFG